MATPNVKTVRVYAVVESDIDVSSCSPVELQQYLREHRFRGDVNYHLHEGGIRTITTKENIPLTMRQLDLLAKG